MKRTVLFLAIIAVLSSSLAVLADDGMWLFTAPPKKQIKAKYKFDITQQWLDELRLASVKPGGCSASFVSPDGLVFTNHHCARACTHDVSTAEHDYMKEGFYAATRDVEPKCTGMALQNLIDIKDVTKDVEAAATPDMDAAAAGKAQRDVMARLEKECSDQPNNIACNVVTLYSGGMYQLYKYKNYRDVRLVMAPEAQMAFFGGDADNFTYPRFDLDITFVRMYENDKPAATPHYLKFSDQPVKEDELVFVSGNPGSTGRLLTTAQLEYLRDVQYPFTIKALDTRIKAYLAYAGQSEDKRRAAENLIFGAQNSFKATTGYRSGLLDKNLMATKAADQKKLGGAIMKDPAMAKQFGGAFDAIAEAMQWQRDNFNRITLMTEAAVPGRIASIARALVRLADPSVPAESRRGNEQVVLSATPVDKDLDILQVRLGLEAVQNRMGDDPFVKTLLDGKSPADRAVQLVNESGLADVAVRKQLMDGGKAAVEASTDPMIVLLRKIDPDARQIRKDIDDNVTSVVRKNGALLAKARFKLYGTDFPPDATGTLRLSYGVHKSYMENGKKIDYFTTIGQAFDYAAKHGDKGDYALPESWMKAKSSLNLNTELDSVNTTDIIGGNSGSPAVNKNLEVVGIIFDGNIQSLPGNFMYEDVIGRSVITNSTAVLEALRKVYSAQPLADELMAWKAKAAPSAHRRPGL
jgi:Peptidase S46